MLKFDCLAAYRTVQLIYLLRIDSQLNFGVLVGAFEESERLSLTIFCWSNVRLVDKFNQVNFSLSNRLPVLWIIFLGDLDHQVGE